MATKQVKSKVVEAFPVGSAWLIRCVTNYWTGRVVRSVEGFLLLEDAAWIADTGRFSDAISSGELNEIEPVSGVVRVSLGSVVDAVEWSKPLPRSKK